MSAAPLSRPRTEPEARCYNQGVSDILAIAKRSAETIGASTGRIVTDRAAAAALDELVKSGAALLICPTSSGATLPASGADP